ncbi:hypothetical protein GOBAR_AA14244 [Gossypium barbadense]|uniref:SKI-interacting protein SKIP SNW domain-containing protein n=1 Tax=Gossypium barbadense TaxID=3634 RepID=A0A2P5XSS0_GOSBA|nr:hypothetical protein GOBAR_AA14244 [Gossypium barbadense]
MAALKDLLPDAKNSTSTYYDHANDPWFKQRFSTSEEEKSTVVTAKPVPPYLKRAGFVPRKVEDFGDGGAFPEIHIAQYPLDMGRVKGAKPGSKILPVTVDARGNLAYDAIVKQNENAKKIIEETMQETKAALEKIVNVRLSAAQPKNVPKQSSDSKYIKYKPSQQSAAFNSGAKERIIRMVEMPVDPLEPPKFKHKRDQQDWKIPPCISNWKNPKGYTIPLDKRLAADGRGLQEVQINDNFAKLSEALYVAEQKAREAVAMRSKRTGTVAPSTAVPMSSDRSVMDTDMRVDYEPVRERERDMPKESKEEREERKITRDRDRDISEKVALGMASTGAGRGGEVMYDQRLFNQEKGMDSGFATDDQYNIYDKGLFTAQPTLSTLYRPKKDVDSEMYGGADEQLEKIMKTERFKPDKAFAGTSEKSGPRDRPVEFEKEVEEADPFGLDQFLTEVKKGKKAMDKVGSGGTMKASAGSSMRDGYEGGSNRSRINFERGH